MRPARLVAFVVRFRVRALLVLLACAGLAQVAAAQQFQSPHIDLGFEHGKLAAAGDLDGDGVVDLVIATADIQAATLKGLGQGAFAPPQIFEAGNQIRALALVDLDESGTLDLVIGRGLALGNSTVVVRFGLGNGSFGPPAKQAVPDGPGDIAVADLDQDGHADLVVPCQTDQKVTVLYGAGNGTYKAITSFEGGPQPESVAVGDLDGDTSPDVVIGNGNPYEPGVSVLLNDGAGGLLAPVTKAFEHLVEDVALGDVNRDGRLDVVVGSEQGYVLPGAGDGTLGPPLPLPPVATDGSASSVLAADFDEDGDADIARTSAGGSIFVYRSRGDFKYEPPDGYCTIPWYVHELIGADLNGDGDLDLLSLGWDTQPGHFATIFEGHGDGTFGPIFRTGPNGPVCVAFGDLDGDGRKDMVGGNPVSGPIQVFHSLGLGGFVRSSVLNGGSSPVSNDMADFDEDGALDLVVVNQEAGASLFLGDGKGGLAPGTPLGLPTNSYPSQVRVADINGDHHADVLVLFATSDGALQVCLGHGDGTFDPPHAVTVPAYSDEFTLGDFNADGRLDAAVIIGNSFSTGWGFVQVLLGDGSGAFAPPLPVTAGGGTDLASTVLASGDLNGDGVPDLVTGNPYQNQVYVILAHGDGTFGPPLPTPVPGFMLTALAVADFDGDGAGDVACAIQEYPPGKTAGTLALLRGHGDGTLDAPQFTNLNPDPMSMTVADIDNDGALDLGIASSRGIQVLLNQGGPWHVVGHPLAGSQGLPKQTGEGPLQAGSSCEISLHDARPLSPVMQVVGLGQLDAPLKGGLLVPTLDLINTALFTNAAGDLVLKGHWPLSGPSGLQLYLQFWIQDPAGVQGWASSAGLRATLP